MVLEALDVVAEVLGLKSLRPPDNDIATKISALFQALDAERLEEAKRLRAELESWAKGFPEPDLARADLLIRRLEHQKQQPKACRMKHVRKSPSEPPELAFELTEVMWPREAREPESSPQSARNPCVPSAVSVQLGDGGHPPGGGALPCCWRRSKPCASDLERPRFECGPT